MKTPRARPILHPTDFSAASRPAFVKAIEFAQARRSDLLLVHVLNPSEPLIGDEYISPPTYQQFRKTSRVWALKQHERLIARARAARVHATALVLEGAEAEQIVALARSRRASMIVMGTHGRSGIARALLGSVASSVLSHAPCPVLTVRAR
jgi:nucleotide-binding universal stress UspA family protein